MSILTRDIKDTIMDIFIANIYIFYIYNIVGLNISYVVMHMHLKFGFTFIIIANQQNNT